MSLDASVLQKLQAPFPEDHIFVRVLEVNEEGNRALLVKFLRHTDVADRLESVDPAWSNKIHRVEPFGDLIFVHMELSILGVSRDNTGEAPDPKSATSDALKRCAMSFGVGRYLCNAEEVWVDYNEATDRGREWTINDYEKGLAVARRSVIPKTPPLGRTPPVKPNKTGPAAKSGKFDPLPNTKSALVAELRRCQKLLAVSEIDLRSWARESAGVSADKMDVPQLQKFVGEFHTEMRKAKIPV